MKKNILVFIIVIMASQLFAQQITLKNGTVIDILNPVKRSKLSRDVKATIVSDTEYKVEGGSLYIKANSELTYDEKDLVISNCILGKESLVKVDGREYVFAKDSKIFLSGGTCISSGVLAKDETIEYAGQKIEIKGAPIPASVYPNYSVSFMLGKLNTILTAKDFEITLDNVVVPVKGLAPMQLRKNGNKEYIYSLRLSRDTKFVKNGAERLYNTIGGYDFDENGKFKGVSSF
jgi:hypothetical protein